MDYSVMPTTRRSFLRRSRPTASPAPGPDATAPPQTTIAPPPQSTTKKNRVRGVSKFDKKPSPKVTGKPSHEGNPVGFRAKRPPSLENETAEASGAVRRPTRTYVRRRYGAGAADVTTTAPGPTTTRSPTEATRRPFRVVGRRRTTGVNSTATGTPAVTTGSPAVETITPAATTVKPAATQTGTEGASHDLAVQESMEKESHDRVEPKRPRKTVKIQRRPLTSGGATASPPPTDEPRKRDGKKYSASFKQNQLDETIRQKSGERETTSSLEELSADTAIAIAAHQLLGAPLPSTSSYEDDSEYTPTKKSSSSSTKTYRGSSTESYPGYPNSKDYSGRVTAYPSSAAFTSTIVNPSSSEIQGSKGTSETVFSSSSPAYSRGSTNAPTVSSSSSTYSRGSTNSPTVSGSTSAYSRGSTNAPIVSGSSSAYSRGSTNAPLSVSSPVYPSSSNAPLVSSRSPVYTREPSSPVYSRGSSYVPSSSRYLGTTNKYVSIPIDDFGFSTDTYPSGFGQEPVYFTRDYLLESPVTRRFETDYQYLTTELPSSRVTKRPSTFRRISSTIAPSTQNILVLPPVTPQPRRSPSKVYDKLPKKDATYRPVVNYDYYDDGDEKLLDKYPMSNKVIINANGNIECLDQGNFPHPASCRRFVSCSRREGGPLVGWEYACPRGLSYDPVGGMCNWSAGLGCNES